MDTFLRCPRVLLKNKLFFSFIIFILKTRVILAAASPTDCDLSYFSYANPNILNATIFKGNELLMKQCIADSRGNSSTDPATITTFTCDELICGAGCIIMKIGNVSVDYILLYLYIFTFELN